jgi:hypothetical protein
LSAAGSNLPDNKQQEKGTLKMAISVGKKNAPFVSSRTPAPDEVSQVRSPSMAGFGMNGFAGASSDVPSKNTMSPLSQNLKSSVDDAGVLDQVIARGTAKSQVGYETVVEGGQESSQLRAISDKNVPNAFGMKSANSGGAPSGKVPPKLGINEAQPVRQPPKGAGQL